jgi:hypothetical protein
MAYSYQVIETTSGYKSRRIITDDQTIPRFGVPAEMITREQAEKLIAMFNETGAWMSETSFKNRSWRYTLL